MRRYRRASAGARHATLQIMSRSPVTAKWLKTASQFSRLAKPALTITYITLNTTLTTPFRYCYPTSSSAVLHTIRQRLSAEQRQRHRQLIKNATDRPSPASWGCQLTTIL
ncbi:hypothetical protein KCP76_03215 [Salmonella enterica subsp. enterica serovar Weltevreden]|nr:hypothetical protein KCP76_03215 [Salmonella enterica subsp. enterica serovar Weltevreden]